jgi:hypothetical protein
MTGRDIAYQRMQSEHLIGKPLDHPVDVVRTLGAVQSQDYPGAKWALSQRTAGATSAEIDQLFNDGAILRTHVMRPTWHFVTPEDIRWMLELTAPRVHAFNAYYYRKSGIDSRVAARSNAAIAEALQGGTQLTRTELREVLLKAGIEVDNLGLGLLMMHAELDGVICSGAFQGKQHTYALLSERAPKATSLPREEALAELVRRYFTSHGPALITDFTWWSGLTVADAKLGIELAKDHLVKEEVDGKTYWLGAQATQPKIERPAIHLLPNYDEYMVAFKDRSPSYDPSRFGDVSAATLADVFYNHIIVLDSQGVGGWQRVIKSKEVVITLKLLVSLSKPERAALQAVIDRYSRFMGMPVTVKD